MFLDLFYKARICYLNVTTVASLNIGYTSFLYGKHVSIIKHTAKGLAYYEVLFMCRGPGILVHVISWLVTLYTLWQLVQMHEIVPGKRFDRYHDLAQHAFGEKVGLWILVPLNLMVEVGVHIVYMVTGGQSLKKFHQTVCRSCKPVRKSYWILIFSSIHYFLSMSPKLSSVAGVSMAAALMSLWYAFCKCINRSLLVSISINCDGK